MLRTLFGWALCALVLGAGLILAGAKAPANALEEEGPPKTALKEGERTLQKGRQGSYCWPMGPGSGACADYAPRFPDVDRVARGSELTVRILEPQRPRSFELTAYRRVDNNDYPMGEGQSVPFDWRRVARNGKTVAWDAVFEVGQPDRHYYMDGFGVWRKGDSSWYFHVKTGA